MGQTNRYVSIDSSLNSVPFNSHGFFVCEYYTGHVAPMYAHPLDANPFFNTNFTINYWIEKGADSRKLVLGMPMYGQSFSLAENKRHTLNSATYGGGEAGNISVLIILFEKPLN